ncbi:MAG: efflux RND transporter periplasmic adaptor subunit [Victivallales bacterium]|nr:efflux RND transporter periplasmic adaptor subunit [Victivallales bacterium]
MPNEDLSARLKALAFIIKYGHDLFSAKTFDDTAANVVNNSRSMLNFRTSVLLESNGRKSRIVAQFGQPEVNPHSRLAVLQQRLADSIIFDEPAVTITADSGLDPELAQNDAVYYALKLTPPPNSDKTTLFYIWLLEYEKEIPPLVPNTARLLANSAAEALFYQRLTKRRLWVLRDTLPKIIFWIILLGAVAALMFIRGPERITAEFTLKAPQVTGAYAVFDGMVANCLLPNGAQVSKGDIIMEYDVSQLKYRLGAATSQLRETEAELALEEQNAFSDQARLARVKLLEAKRNTAKVAVEEAQWYLEHAQITAPADGFLVITGGLAELFAGRAVKTGDKLFEIHGGDGMLADIPVNEQNASILAQSPKLELFLHTAPENALDCQIIDIARLPELTEQKTYCYHVQARLDNPHDGLRFGMRGVAKLSAGDYSLGYRLFKNVILYTRKF